MGVAMVRPRIERAVRTLPWRGISKTLLVNDLFLWLENGLMIGGFGIGRLGWVGERRLSKVGSG